jgi:hypothetical protein
MNAHVRDNLDVLYTSHPVMRAGCGYDASSATGSMNADGGEFDTYDRLVLDLATADDEGTVQVRTVITYQLSAVNSATSVTARAQAYVEAATASTGSVNTNIGIYTAAALTGGSLTTGFKSADSGWVSAASLVTNISGYGIALLRPRWRIDYVTGAGPSIFHYAVTYLARVA